MQGDQNNHGKYHNDYAKQGKMINQYNQHVSVLNNHGNEEQKKKNKILNQDNQSHNQHVKYPKQIYQ